MPKSAPNDPSPFQGEAGWGNGVKDIHPKQAYNNPEWVSSFSLVTINFILWRWCVNIKTNIYMPFGKNV